MLDAESSMLARMLWLDAGSMLCLDAHSGSMARCLLDAIC
jgi:hypothetical protein